MGLRAGQPTRLRTGAPRSPVTVKNVVYRALRALREHGLIDVTYGARVGQPSVIRLRVTRISALIESLDDPDHRGDALAILTGRRPKNTTIADPASEPASEPVSEPASEPVSEPHIREPKRSLEEGPEADAEENAARDARGTALAAPEDPRTARTGIEEECMAHRDDPEADGPDAVIGTPGVARVPRKPVPTFIGRVAADEAAALAQARLATPEQQAKPRAIEAAFAHNLNVMLRHWRAGTSMVPGVSPPSRAQSYVPRAVPPPVWKAGQLKALARKLGAGPAPTVTDWLRVREFLRATVLAWPYFHNDEQYGLQRWVAQQPVPSPGVLLAGFNELQTALAMRAAVLASRRGPA